MRSGLSRSVGTADPWDLCSWACPVAGFVAGLGALGESATTGLPSGRVWATVVAGLTAAIGCAPLGIGSLVAVLAAIVAGALAAAALRGKPSL